MLKPKASFSRRINPSSESDLVVEWIDPSGQTYSSTVDVHFEHNFRGRIEITVEPDNTIRWTDAIKP